LTQSDSSLAKRTTACFGEPFGCWSNGGRTSHLRLLSLESVLTPIAESHVCGCSVFADCGPLTAKRNLGGHADCYPPLTAQRLASPV